MLPTPTVAALSWTVVPELLLVKASGLVGAGVTDTGVISWGGRMSLSCTLCCHLTFGSYVHIIIPQCLYVQIKRRLGCC